MANAENLKVKRSPSEARKNGKMGGIASGKARREKKALREVCAEVLNTPIKPGSLTEIKTLADVKGANLTMQQAATLAVAQKAMKGDVRALEFLRDTAGQKPADRVEVSQDVESAEAEIAALIESMKADAG